MIFQMVIDDDDFNADVDDTQSSTDDATFISPSRIGSESRYRTMVESLNSARPDSVSIKTGVRSKSRPSSVKSDTLLKS